jgi:hypothetical protein
MSEGLGTLKADAKLIVEEGYDKEKVDGIYPAKVFGPKNPVDEVSLDAFDTLFEDAAKSSELVQGPKAGALPPAISKKAAGPKAENPNELGF